MATPWGELPVELLQPILLHTTKNKDLTRLCLVNKYFHSLSAPLLYEWIAIYPWRKRAQAKIHLAIRTLRDNVELAKNVKILEFRTFPQNLQGEEEIWFFGACQRALSNCINLKSLVWTRDRSLSTELLQTLRRLPSLEAIEMNGHSGSVYNPATLILLTNLKRISLLMPDRAVIEALPEWVRNTGASLQHLSLVCKDSTALNDTILTEIAQSAPHLESLHLAGCIRVTDVGVLAVLRASQSRVTSLGVERLSQAFNMDVLSQFVIADDLLRKLHTFTITCPQTHSVSTRESVEMVMEDWVSSVSHLLSNCDALQLVTFYAVGGTTATLPKALIQQLVLRHGRTLKKFAVQRLAMSASDVETVCQGCPNLEALYITASDPLVMLPCLSKATSLRSIHVNIESGLDTIEDTKPSFYVLEYANRLVSSCASSLLYVGVLTKVWEVIRTVHPIGPATNSTVEEQEWEVEVELAPYSGQGIPEQFLVLKA